MSLILFLVVDDLRPEIRSFGHQKLVTPNLDALAESGIRFDRAYCQYPQCMPSRCSVMSGKRPDTWCDTVSTLCANGEATLPAHFRAHGFDTMSIGKVYHREYDDQSSWSRLDDASYYELESTGMSGYCSGYQRPDNRRAIAGYTGRLRRGAFSAEEAPRICECVDAPDEAYPDNRIARRAAQAIATHAENDRDLFLAVGFYRPHLPWAVPKRYWDLYDRDEIDLATNQFLPRNAIGGSDLCDFIHYGEPEILSTYSDLGTYSEDTFPLLCEDKQRECVHGYWASVSFIDAQIGIVLGALRDTHLQESASVVLWGDNGWHLGEHALWSKTTHFEESTRVPLLISSPGVTPPGDRGRVSTGLCELLDLYPTLCDLAEIPSPPHLQGSSLAPRMKRPDLTGKPAIHSVCVNGETVRTERYRLTYYPRSVDVSPEWHVSAKGQYELFDLGSDPAENVNVAAQPEYADVVRDLSSQLLFNAP